ncbi:MAG TPA: hypothetical protein VMT00_09270 [Thermoanaerobaculia bacterium]|nr:hypothetical protein [Thermoanaerobaculia bacterium]
MSAASAHRPEKHVTARIPASSCSACAFRAERRLQRLPGVKEATIDPALGEISLVVDFNATSLVDVMTSLASEGLDVTIARVAIPLDTTGFGTTASRIIEARIGSMEGVASVRLDLVTSVAIVEYRPGSTELDAIRAELFRGGCPPNHAAPERHDPATERRIVRTLDGRLVVSLLGASAATLLYLAAVGIPGGRITEMVPHSVADLPPVALDALLIAVVLIAAMLVGRGQIPRMWRGIRNRCLHFDVLVWLAMAVGIVAGLAAIPIEGRIIHELPLASAWLLTLHTLAHRVDRAMCRRFTRTASALQRLRPDRAIVIRDGREVEIEIEDLQQEDVVVAAQASTVPADGTITSGSAELDESIFGGSTTSRGAGAQARAGSRVVRGRIELRAERWGPRALLWQLGLMQWNNLESNIERKGAGTAAWLGPAVLIAAIVTAIFWLNVSPSTSIAAFCLISILVAFPIPAIHRAAQAALRSTRDALAERGAFFSTTEGIEIASRIEEVVLLDSALHPAEPVVTEFVLLDGISQTRLLSFAAAALEARSGRVDRAIVQRAAAAGIAGNPAIQMRSDPFGVEAVVDGRIVIAGQPRFLTQSAVDLEPVAEELERFTAEGRHVVPIAIDGRVAGLLVVQMDIAPEARASVERLEQLGIVTRLVTCASQATARAVGSQLGIDAVEAETTRADQAAAVSRSARESKNVAVIGSVESEPLSRAGLGVCIRTPDSFAVPYRDLTLLRHDLSLFVDSIVSSKRAVDLAARSKRVAMIYGVAALLLAGGVLYPLTGFFPSPVLAAIGVVAVSIGIDVAALRLRRNVRGVAP